MNLETLTAAPVCADNPFPGLRPFEAHESDIFFGREDDIFDLLDRLRHMRFLAVVGASGCGKSSLIRAGLIASLTEGALPGEWRVAVLRPWQSPVAQLAAALSRKGALDVPGDPEEAAAVVRAILQRGSLGVVEALQRYPLPAGESLLILVDQFEELFTFMFESDIKGAQEEGRAFVKLLLEALRPRDEPLPVYVALTMRSDFLGKCALFPGLADAINNGLYLLPQMSREQLRDAVVGPVEACGGKISERLVNTLINDLSDDTDQLPILQHALMRLWGEWRRRGGEKIDFDDYRQIGEMNASLSNHAEEVFAALGNRRRRKIAESLFRAITRVTDDGKIVRSAATLARIREFAKLGEAETPELAAVIDAFRAKGRSFLVPPPEELGEASLITPDKRERFWGVRRTDLPYQLPISTIWAKPLGDETVIDFSHESLIRQWGRLRGWAEDEAMKRELGRQITEAARVWEKRGREEDSLFRGKRLLEADAWSKNNPGVLSQSEEEFLVASQNAYEREILEQPKRDLSVRVASEGETQVEAIEKGGAHVFLAFARKDRQFAERLRESFRVAGEETLVDWDILPSEEFAEHVLTAVEAADTFVFVISPASIDSKLCRQQLQHAVKQNKRVVPVLYRKVEEWRLPEELKAEHWVRFTEDDDFNVAFGVLREAIKTDLFWVRAHTRLLVRATEWNKKDRDPGQLLRGRELSEAEQWLGKEGLEPELTPLQKQYIIASRGSVTRWQKRIAAVSVAGLVLLALATAMAAFYAASASEQAEVASQKQAEATRAKDDAMKAEKEAKAREAEAREASAQATTARDEEAKERERAEKAVENEKAQRLEAQRQRLIALEAANRAQLASTELKRQRAGGQRIAEIFKELADLEQQGKGDTIEVIVRLHEVTSLYNQLGYYNVTKFFLEDFIDEEQLDEMKFAEEDPRLVANIMENYVEALRYLGDGKKADDVMVRVRALLARPKKSPTPAPYEEWGRALTPRSARRPS